MNETAKRRLAIILSGGGARGAYEAGVLSYLFDDLARLRGGPPRVDILCGTSVGAINSGYLAAHLGDPVLGVRRLADVWTGLALDDVLGFSLRQALSLPRVLFGGGAGTGLFDVSPMAQLVQREIPWRAITRSLRRGLLSALSVSATEVMTGRTVIFMQTGPNTALPTRAPPRTLIRADRIGPHHVLASAAIPLLFPPVRIGSQLYVDGGVRQNTPIAPAIRLGATHVLVVGTSAQVRGVQHTKEAPTAMPGATFLLGKMMNALLLDHLDNDLAMINVLNDVMATGESAYGPDYVDHMNKAAGQRSGLTYRPIDLLVTRPTENIGALAAEHIRSGRLKAGPLLTKRLFHLLDVGVADDADLASYLLFDGGFARRLVELGRSDAQARKSELLDFLGRVAEEGPLPDDGGDTSGGWTIPPPAVG